VGRLHRSKHATSAVAALAAAALAAGACSRDAVVTTRTVTLHTPKACAVSSDAFAQYFELGDFEAAEPTTGHAVGDVGSTLTELDPAARALVVEATESNTGSNATWSGVAPVDSSGDVDVLLLPSLSACALTGQPGARPGAAMAAVGGDLALVVGGGVAANAPATYVANLSTGALAPLAGPDLGAVRARTTVTAFGDGALVAGGVALRMGATESTAETFSATGGFDSQHPILLSEPRSDHGAVVLAGGQTLLVGGVGTDGMTPLASMDRVDPATKTAQEQGLAVLAVARRAPQVLRLASGEILVAGGFDASGALVPTIEWFAADASHATRGARDLVTGATRTVAPLGGGGALAVVAPPAGADASFLDVWVIDADGAFEAATPLPDVAAPVLFPGAGGAPVLWTGASSDGSSAGRWLRWQPWNSTFGALGVLDMAPANVGAVTASGDPGLAMWLDGATSALTMLRFDTRGPYASLDGPLLSTTSADMAPDRLAATGVASFDAATGLTLGPGASAFVTDRTYADVTVSVAAPTGEPAMLVLRDDLGVELEVGGVTCPGALAKTGEASSLQVTRSGTLVGWSISTGATGTCPTPLRSGARLSIGVRAPGDATRSVARDLVVTRVAP
jgi:hypothetical protein